MLERYAWLQEAKLYAHFAPVALIHHGRLLSDFPSDGLGKGSIWERIKKAGENKFYRVEYSDENNEDEISDPQKKEKDKRYIEDSSSKDKLINTSVADTPYIRNVIEVFVHGNTNEGKINQLYYEPGEQPC